MNHRVQPGGKLISMIAGAPLSVAFILCLTTCQASTTPESNLAPKASSAQDPSKRGAYQHIKDCADQAERMVARKGWRQDRLAAEEESTFVGAENHYSSKYDRCYLRASFFTSQAPDNPVTFYKFYDAFEGRLLAFCNDVPSLGGGATKRTKFFCSIEEKVNADTPFAPGSEHVGDCEFCRSFIADRWNN